MRNELWDDAVKERISKGLPEVPRGRRPPHPKLSEERLKKLRANQSALYPDPKDVSIRTGPDPQGYDGRPIEERDIEERFEVRARRAEVALAMGLAITDDERELLGLK